MLLIPIFQIVLKRNGSLKTTQRQCRHSRDVAEMLREYLRDVDREHFVVLALNRKHRVLGIHTVSMGSLTASVVHPREVMTRLGGLVPMGRARGREGTIGLACFERLS